MNIVFDIGGTNMRIAAANGDVLEEVRKVPTPKDPYAGIESFVKTAQELVPGPITALGGGIAADYIRDGVLSGATNLPSWNGLDLIRALDSALHVPAVVVNDTVAAAVGERAQGAGRGFARVAYMTVSTGVGATCVADDLSASPILRELQERIGDLESRISGTAVRKKFGIEPKELDSLEERNKLADTLAEALIQIIEAWRPEVFVLGGSMILGVNPIPIERVQEKCPALPIKKAELGDNCGLIGGAILAAGLS